MELNAAMQNDIASIQQAMSMHSLEQAMNRDGATVSKLLEGLEETNKAVQRASESHRGNIVDIRV